ncbi:hypothetical protein B0H13DRAFT_2362919 [Mycena leptocephala]|nr:hypothetical protein B0H13DRAFT_2362919 [Mycena leptocephala]
MVERPYVKSDFVGLNRRKPYIVMIERQPEKLPKGLNLSKINIPDMQKLLLDPQIGFTINLPGEGEGPTPTPETPNPKSTGDDRQTNHSLEPPNPSSDAIDANFPGGLEDLIQPDIRDVQLRIRDRRSRSSEFNVIQRVNIHVVDNVDCRDNEWRASSDEIFSQLQASIAQLDGRIGVPDSEEREYTEYFVTFNTEDKTETFSHNLRNIIIPDGNKLELRVDPVHNKRPRTSSPIPSSMVESSRPSSSALVAKPQAAADAGVTWLLEKIEKRSGYTKFNSNRGKVLQNPDRVESWRFAAQVTSTFHKTSWPTEISSTTKISKTAIEKALGISTTSLNEAINMTRIIAIYGCDGPNRSAEVIAEVNKIQQADALGASALKFFLQSWANDHPIADN